VQDPPHGKDRQAFLALNGENRRSKQMDRKIEMERRVFVMKLVSAATLLGSSGLALAETKPMVNEADPQAVNLNYKADAAGVKHAKFKPGQACSNCVLFQGKPTDAAGGCGIFPGKQVASKGWCAAYAKKA